MIKYLINKLKGTNNKTNKLEIIRNNFDFIDNLNEESIEKFFNYLLLNNNSIFQNIKIIENKNYFNNSSLNQYYNDWFSKYELVNINNSEIIIENNYKITNHETDEILINKIIIGNYGIDYLFIKKNSENNKIFLQNYNTKEDVEKDIAVYKNIYEVFFKGIDFFSNPSSEINLKDEYEKYKSTIK